MLLRIVVSPYCHSRTGHYEMIARLCIMVFDNAFVDAAMNLELVYIFAQLNDLSFFCSSGMELQIK